MVERREEVGLDELSGGLRLGEGDVVLHACAQLRQHVLHVGEVRLVDLDLVGLLEAAQQLLVDVLRPVEVGEVAVGLERLGRLWAASTVSGSPNE